MMSPVTRIRRPAGADGPGAGGEFDTGDQAQVADVDDVPGALNAVGGFLEMRGEFGGALEQCFVAVGVHRGDGGGAGQDVGGVGVAVEKFDGAWGAGHEGFVDVGGGNGGTHRHCGVGDALGQAEDVWRDAETVGGEGGAEAAEAADHFVEDQQDAVFGADVAELLQVADGGWQNAG